LSSTDWTTFNAKQNAITLTTTGTSGAATLVGATLNIPQYQGVLTNPVTGTGTTNTLPKFTGASTIGNSNITDSGSLITLGSNSFLNGNVGIGTTANSAANLLVEKNITGATVAYGIFSGGVIQSGVTSAARLIQTNAQTAAATFTIANIFHYFANQATFGAGSTVNVQTGFFVESTLIGATNNYGFRGLIPSGTNRWNLFMDGTAANYLAGQLLIGTTTTSAFALDVNGTARVSGQLTANSFVPTSSTIPTNGMYLSGTNTLGFATNGTLDMVLDANGALGIGSTSLTSYNLRISKNITGSTTSISLHQDGVIQSDVVTLAIYNQTEARTAAASFTLTNLYHYLATQGTFGAGSSVTNQVGFWAGGNLIGATNNFGFYGNIPSGTNRWNLYMNGTAANFIQNQLLIGTTTTGLYQLDVMISGTAGIIDVAKFGALGNGGAGRGVGIVLGASGSSSTVSVARLVGYQETASATANNASFAIQVANSSGTLTEYLRINNVGSVGIGTTSLTGYSLRINRNPTGATTSYGVTFEGTIQSDVTSGFVGYRTNIATLATTFTTGFLVHYSANQSTFGAGSTVSNQYGFIVESNVIGATNNFGFYGNIPAGTNRWNLYMAGTAANYMAGSLGIGSTVIETKLDIDISNTSTSVAFGNSIKVENTDTTVGNLSSIMLSQSGDAAATIAGIHTSRTPGSRTSDLGLYSYQQSGSGITERVRVKSTGQMRFVPLASDPSGAQAGDVYYNSTTNALKLYDGTVWRTITVV
jgi:hypothetical protein